MFDTQIGHQNRRFYQICWKIVTFETIFTWMNILYLRLIFKLMFSQPLIGLCSKSDDLKASSVEHRIETPFEFRVIFQVIVFSKLRIMLPSRYLLPIIVTSIRHQQYYSKPPFRCLIPNPYKYRQSIIAVQCCHSNNTVLLIFRLMNQGRFILNTLKPQNFKYFNFG